MAVLLILRWQEMIQVECHSYADSPLLVGGLVADESMVCKYYTLGSILYTKVHLLGEI